MDIREAIKERHSVRQYIDRPIPSELKAELEALIKECNIESGLHIQIVYDDPECFESFLARYGKFTNVQNYVAIAAKKSLENRDELGGYYGQRIVLRAQQRGLSTCWVGGTYKKGKCKVELPDDEKLICVIAIGYGATAGTPHKSKPLSQLCDVPEEQMPNWFKNGMYAAMLAPTAMNQQRFHVTIREGEPVITSKIGPFTKVDLGIVKCNFESACGHKCR